MACALQSAGYTIEAETGERRADFVVNQRIRIEVGGPKKEKKGAEYLVRDRVDVPIPGVIPLWVLGMMW